MNLYHEEGKQLLDTVKRHVVTTVYICRNKNYFPHYGLRVLIISFIKTEEYLALSRRHLKK